MELSIRDAKARFAEAAAAAARGERVVVTKHGHPFVELVAARRRDGIDFEALDRIRKTAGLDDIELNLADDFDDPSFSRRVLGLDE